jgi:hypothetical protein
VRGTYQNSDKSFSCFRRNAFGFSFFLKRCRRVFVCLFLVEHVSRDVVFVLNIVYELGYT